MAARSARRCSAWVSILAAQSCGMRAARKWTRGDPTGRWGLKDADTENTGPPRQQTEGDLWVRSKKNGRKYEKPLAA